MHVLLIGDIDMLTLRLLDPGRCGGARMDWLATIRHLANRSATRGLTLVVQHLGVLLNLSTQLLLAMPFKLFEAKLLLEVLELCALLPIPQFLQLQELHLLLLLLEQVDLLLLLLLEPRRLCVLRMHARWWGTTDPILWRDVSLSGRATNGTLRIVLLVMLRRLVLKSLRSEGFPHLSLDLLQGADTMRLISAKTEGHGLLLAIGHCAGCSCLGHCIEGRELHRCRRGMSRCGGRHMVMLKCRLSAVRLGQQRKR